MLPDQVSNPGSLTYESGALPIALRGPASQMMEESSIEMSEVSKYIMVNKHTNSKIIID